MGDSLLLGLEEWLSLGKGLGERLLTNLWETERETQMLFQLLVSLWMHSVCVCVLGAGIPLLQHGLLCAQVGHFISQQANLPLIVIKSLQLPLINLQLLMGGSQT